MTGNPYATNLTITAWSGFVLGIILGVVSSLIDPVNSSLFYGDSIDGTAVWWKVALGLLADACIAIGIGATIGWTVLAGVEWRLGQGTRANSLASEAPPPGEVAPGPGPRTLEEADRSDETARNAES